MKRVFVGHRGVGKTSLLCRHQKYIPAVPHFDLDNEIELKSKQKVSEIFSKDGELSFRKLEVETFNRLISENSDFVISLGAGFDISAISENIEVIFVSRVTDKDGRVFLNRPRLNSDLTPLEEYKMRFAERNLKFIERANAIYHLPEGSCNDRINDIERQILVGEYLIKDAYYTLVSSEVKSIQKILKNFVKIELRTDLLSCEDIEMLVNEFPNVDWLVSVRNDNRVQLPTGTAIDLDVQYVNSGQSATIVSCHLDDIADCIAHLETHKKKTHLKLCPLVHNFDQLILGYNWQQQDPQYRSFLPRSLSGRWQWYRQLAIHFQKMNFIRNFTDILDQPTLYNWLLSSKEKFKSFGAVIGTPVYFSRTPAVHNTFLTIEILDSEWGAAIHFLKRLGLNRAAVTSPLKKSAFEYAEVKSESALKYQAVNTLYFDDKKIYGHNTDGVGFDQLTKGVEPDKTVLIWGGGGTKAMILNRFPYADIASARSGQLVSQKQFKSSYDVLIWAAPRTEQTQFPPIEIEIKKIIDLNYRENSMGIELAVMRGLPYISGLEMFYAQALEQKKYWSSYECK